MKYFLLGAFSSGFFLYGVALVYGFAGSMQLSARSTRRSATTPATSTLLLIGMGMLAVGLLFKVGAAPFQAWTPDVYQGAPTAVTAFMAAVHQDRGVRRDAAAVLRRLRLRPLDLAADAVGDRDPHHGRRRGARGRADRREADAGLLLGRPHRLPAHRRARRAERRRSSTSGQVTSLQAVLFYLATYGFAMIGAFAVVTLVRDSGGEATQFARWAGLGPPLAAAGRALRVLPALDGRHPADRRLRRQVGGLHGRALGRCLAGRDRRHAVQHRGGRSSTSG